MSITTISSRELNQAPGEAKRASNNGPVFITDRGRPAHVLMSMEQYQRLTGCNKKIADLLAMPGVQDLDLEIPHFPDLALPADFV